MCRLHLQDSVVCKLSFLQTVNSHSPSNVASPQTVNSHSPVNVASLQTVNSHSPSNVASPQMIQILSYASMKTSCTMQNGEEARIWTGIQKVPGHSGMPLKGHKQFVQIPLTFVPQNQSHQPWQCHKIQQVQIFELQFKQKTRN